LSRRHIVIGRHIVRLSLIQRAWFVRKITG